MLDTEKLDCNAVAEFWQTFRKLHFPQESPLVDVGHPAFLFMQVTSRRWYVRARWHITAAVGIVTLEHRKSQLHHLIAFSHPICYLIYKHCIGTTEQSGVDLI